MDIMRSGLLLRELHAVGFTPASLALLAAPSHLGLTRLRLSWSSGFYNDDEMEEFRFAPIAKVLEETLVKLGKLTDFHIELDSLWPRDWEGDDNEEARAGIVWTLPAATDVTVSVPNSPLIVAPNALRMRVDKALRPLPQKSRSNRPSYSLSLSTAITISATIMAGCRTTSQRRSGAASGPICRLYRSKARFQSII